MEEPNDRDTVDSVESVGDVQQNNVNSEIFEPVVGMEFFSVEDVKTFYRMYASSKGFKLKVRTSRKGDDGELKYLILACAREGNRLSKIPTIVKTLPTQVANCEAKITAGKGKNGVWSIKRVVLDHCHDLSSTKARVFNTNKSISTHVKRSIEINDESNDEEKVRINKTFQSLTQHGGQCGNLSLIEHEVKNYIDKERYAIGQEGDFKALVSYFCGMKKQNRNFWYEIDVDKENQVKNVFWADARSRAAYEAFGDVVSFDTTYLTKKYNVPFVSFLGVNHHGQSMLFGCGLLSAEDIESFVWLFESWIRCMSGKPPQGIMTDQCMAMQKAIEIVFPNTRHRWCLWKIIRMLPNKLNGYVAYKIKCAMKEVVCESCSKEEFDKRWCSFLKEFDIEKNKWLSGLFNERHKWVPIFLKKDFWAGLSTTQRSESIDVFLDGHVNSMTSLDQFVEQYDNTLRSKEEKESEADFHSMNTIIRCGSNSPIEKQFQAEYTHAKFSEVQIEFREKMNCGASLKCVEGTVATYQVLEEFIAGDQPEETMHEVVFHRETHDVSCQCLLFEFRGIMCRHSLCVLALERVRHVPSKYILSRWSKKIKWRHSLLKSSYDATEAKARAERYDKLCKHFHDVAEVAAKSDETSKLLHLALDQAYCDLQVTSSLNNLSSTLKGDDIVNNQGESCTNEAAETHSPFGYNT